MIISLKRRRIVETLDMHRRAVSNLGSLLERKYTTPVLPYSTNIYKLQGRKLTLLWTYLQKGAASDTLASYSYMS